MRRGEYLCDGIVDAEFVKLFAPIHIMQLLLGSTHNDLRDGFMMPITGCQKLYTLIIVFLATYSLHHFLVFYISNFYAKSVPLCVALVAGALMQYTAYMAHVYHSRFSKDHDDTAKLYLKLQKIDRVLKLNNVPSFSKKHYQFNCFMVVFTATVYPCGYLIHVCFCVDNWERTLFLGFGLMVIYIENLLTGSLIYYVGLRLKLLNKMIGLNIVFKKQNNIPVDLSLEVDQAFRIIIESPNNRKQTTNENSFDLKTFIICLRIVLNSYKLITRRFRLCTFTTAFTVYFWTFLIIEAIVVGRRTGLFSIIATITIVIWIVYYYMQLTVLAITVDWFGRQVKETKSLCIYALSIYFEGPVYTAAKDQLRLLEMDKLVFSIYGIFIITRSLPMKLLGLIANNVVILLQFTL